MLMLGIKIFKNKTMDNKYRVSLYMDNEYIVLNKETDEELYKGSLSDCEAFIRLQEGGYF